MLREMLDQEEKTREILEKVQKHQLPSSSSISLPASLPPKVPIYYFINIYRHFNMYVLLHIYCIHVCRRASKVSKFGSSEKAAKL